MVLLLHLVEDFNDLPGKDNLLIHNEAKGAMGKTYPLSWSLDIFIV